MLNKADIKFVKSLADRSVRHAKKLFVAEGSKSVLDLLASKMNVSCIYAEKDWIDANYEVIQGLEFDEATTRELEQMSNLRSTREVLGVFHIPEQKKKIVTKGLTIAVERLQDPGNLGTLIRLADWYGISTIVCSPDTVDCYNTKVVQATMGSLGRVDVLYADLETYFMESGLPVIAGSMDGEPARGFTFPVDMILLIGSEGSGISMELSALVSQSISIERLGQAESLNASMAGAILVDRYFGQQ